MKAIKIAVIDPSLIYRLGIDFNLSSYKDLQVVVQSENAQRFLLKNTVIDIVLMDVEMPLRSSENTILQIRGKYPNTKIILLSTYEDERTVFTLMEAGASGFLSKSSEGSTIYQTIKTVMEEGFCSNEIINRAMRAGLEKMQGKSNEINLDTRELSILKLICEEKTTKEMTKILFMSPSSINKVRRDINAKTGTDSTAGLVRYAVRLGVIEA
jgi:DNA-binding NarL/FixJ family response regulator